MRGNAPAARPARACSVSNRARGRRFDRRGGNRQPNPTRRPVSTTGCRRPGKALIGRCALPQPSVELLVDEALHPRSSPQFGPGLVAPAAQEGADQSTQAPLRPIVRRQRSTRVLETRRQPGGVVEASDERADRGGEHVDSVAAATGAEGRLGEFESAPGDPPPRRRREEVCTPRGAAHEVILCGAHRCLSDLDLLGVPTRASRKDEVDGASRHGDESDGGRKLGEKQARASPRQRRRPRDHRLRALLERPRAESRGEGARIACELAAGAAAAEVGVEQEVLELRELVVQAQRRPATRVLTARMISRHA